MDLNNWAEKEFETVDLGDARLNQRLIKMSQHFLDAPESHINKACGDWSETKAAYRFFKMIMWTIMRLSILTLSQL